MIGGLCKRQLWAFSPVCSLPLSKGCLSERWGRRLHSRWHPGEAEGSGCILEVQTVDEEGWDDVEVVPVEMR